MFARLNPTAVLVAGVVLFAVTCGSLLGLYALAPDKPSIGPLFAGIPAGVAALVSLAVAGVQRGHGRQLKTISKNTNGVLTQRINEAVATSVATHVPVAVASALAVPAQRKPAGRRTSAKAKV